MSYEERIKYELPDDPGERARTLDAIPSDWDDLEGRLTHPAVYDDNREGPVKSELEARFGHDDGVRLKIEADTDVESVKRLEEGIEPKHVIATNWGSLSPDSLAKGTELLSEFIEKGYEGSVTSRWTHSRSSPRFSLSTFSSDEEVGLYWNGGSYATEVMEGIASDLEDLGLEQMEPRQVA